MNRRQFAGACVLGGTVAATISPLFVQRCVLADNAATSANPAAPDKRLEWVDIGSGLELRYYFASDEFATYALAEVRNTTDVATPSPSILLTLLDGDENIVGSANLIDVYPIVDPARPTPYQVVLDPSIEPNSWSSVTIEANPGYGEASCSSGIEVRDIEKKEQTSEQLRVRGKVFNGGNLPLDGVLVWAAIYRTDGVFAGVINKSIQATIPSGKTAAFELFGLRVPGLQLPNSKPTYTYRIFATNITGGSSYC